MINLQDIHSLTDFARNTKKHVNHMKKTGRPAVLTINGRAEFVVQDAKSYQHLLDLAQGYNNHIKLEQAFNDIDAGRVYDLDEVVTKLKKKHLGKTVKTNGLSSKLSDTKEKKMGPPPTRG